MQPQAVRGVLGQEDYDLLTCRFYKMEMRKPAVQDGYVA